MTIIDFFLFPVLDNKNSGFSVIHGNWTYNIDLKEKGLKKMTMQKFGNKIRGILEYLI